MTVGEYLTPGEQEALEVKSIRSRARAIEQFLHLAEKLGVSNEQTSAVVEKIRQADAEEWTRLRKAAGHLALFLVDVPEVSREPIAQTTEEVPIEAHIAENEAAPVAEPAETSALVEAVEQEPSGTISSQGISVLRRLVGDATLNAEDLKTSDIRTIVNAIAQSTLSGELIDTTREKLQHILAGVPYKEIPSGHPTVGNLRTSILKADNANKLRILLTSAPVSTVLHAVPRPPSTPLVYAHPQKRIQLEQTIEVEASEEGPVAVAELVPTAETENADIDEILRVSLERPQVVTVSEWCEAAHQKLLQVAEGRLSEEATTQLWDWIHFDAEKELPEDLGNEGRRALRVLQNLYLSADKSYFNSHPYQNIAARTLVVVARGIKTLPEICAKMHQRKAPKDEPKLTDTIAQRHVVAAVTYLLEQDV